MARRRRWLVGSQHAERRKESHKRRRQRLRERLEARGLPAAEVDAAVERMRAWQARERAAIRSEEAAWRLRHPRLTDQTIRLVVAELRRNRTGAA